MKAFRVIVPGYNHGIIKAETAGKARYQAYKALRSAIGETASLTSIKIVRAPQYDSHDFPHFFDEDVISDKGFVY